MPAVFEISAGGTTRKLVRSSGNSYILAPRDLLGRALRGGVGQRAEGVRRGALGEPQSKVGRERDMNHWRSARLWLVFWALLVPSAFAFALPGALFGSDAAFEQWWWIILPLQALVTVAAPYAVARRPIAARQSRRGFTVVQLRNSESEINAESSGHSTD